MRAVVLESDAPSDLRKQRVVLTQADIEPGTEAPAVLAYEDRSAGDKVAVMPLDTEPLGIAIPAVA